jgi:hypothetical protein
MLSNRVFSPQGYDSPFGYLRIKKKIVVDKKNYKSLPKTVRVNVQSISFGTGSV